MATVGLPRLTLATRDSRDVARVIRGALRLRTEIVKLVDPPVGPGQHLLDIELPDGGSVAILAEPAGSARPDGFPLSVRPVTRVQMAELFALVERLDEPSRTDPPPSDTAAVPDERPTDDTVVDTAPSSVALLPTSSAALFEFATPEQSSRVGRTHATTPSAEYTPVYSQGADAQRDRRIGRMLADKYRIEAPIGRGASAIVYRAMHEDLRRPVAVKVLHTEHQTESQFLRRFKAEALTASKLEHVNVTRVVDFGEERGEVFLVMELVAGRSLEALLAEKGPMPAKRVVEIGVQVSRALVFAHGKGVIHRDIKPENVMLVPDLDDDGKPCDLVKVCDFGLAKMRGGSDGDSVDLTVAGALCGSPAYMSPEQTRGERVDARTDIYSLGVMLFEALTGVLPFDASSIEELFVKKCTGAPSRPSELVEGVDPLLDDVIVRAMAIDPGERHASARELRAELRAARDQIEEAEGGADHATLHGG